MASPFRAFRKYQKTLIAVAGVVLMFVFVLADPLTSYMRNSGPGGGGGGSRQRPNDVAVQWDGGKLTNLELDQLVVQRRVLNNFLMQVQGYGQKEAQAAGGDLQPLRVATMVGPERPEQGVERDVLRVHLMADMARKAGMAISDDYLVNYLEQLGRGYVSVATLRQLISLNGKGASIDYVLDALREEMLARNYLASYYYALETELPEDRWRDWLRVNDRVVAEAVAIPAESLLTDVKEPTDAELKAFFDEYKDAPPVPDTTWGIELPSPTPAFKIPQKVSVQYLKADFNEYLTKVEDEVTDAEIQKFYDDNKDRLFIKADSLLGDPGDLSEAKPDAEEPSDQAEEKPLETPAEQPATEQPTDTPASETETAPASNQGSGLSHRSPFRLTAFQEESPAASSAPAADTAGPAAPEAAPAAEPAQSTTLDAPAEKALEFQPLDEVRDQIRRAIAETKVSEQLQELMTNVEHELNNSYSEYFGASLEADEAGKEPPPPPKKLADLTPFSTAHGLTFKKTDPATWQQLRDTDIGISRRPEWGNAPYFAAILNQDYELYEPVASQDLDANRYVSMKTSDTPSRVPTLDEVRDEVVRAWKMREAGKLAIKRAEELAKKAQDAGGSLTDAIAGDQSLSIVKTDPFAFFTIGNVSRDTQQVTSFRLSEPDGIVAAGPEFMEKVFELKDGQVAAAPNHDHSIAYVVKATEHLNSLAELQQLFLADDNRWYGVPVMAQGHFRTALNVLVADALKSANVDWVRPADQIIRPEEETDAEAAELEASKN
jgi:hypothetical protein